jgi:hypothetical protein
MRQRRFSASAASEPQAPAAEDLQTVTSASSRVSGITTTLSLSTLSNV